MITFDEFMQLGCGDLVIWCGRRLRTVLTGPRDQDGSDRVIFPIAHRSWTGRPHTTYGFNDIKDKIELAAPDGEKITRAELLLDSEYLALQRWNPDLKKRLAAELRDQQATFDRCSRWLRPYKNCEQLMKGLRRLKAPSILRGVR